MLNGYGGFDWEFAIVVNAPAYQANIGCLNGYTRGALSPPNVLANNGGIPGYMLAPARKVFRIDSLFATSAWHRGATATFTGYDGSGTVLRQKTATINSDGPVRVDLSSLGFISTLKWEQSGGQDVSDCGNGNFMASDNMAIDNMALTSKSTVGLGWHKICTHDCWLNCFANMQALC